MKLALFTALGLLTAAASTTVLAGQPGGKGNRLATANEAGGAYGGLGLGRNTVGSPGKSGGIGPGTPGAGSSTAGSPGAGTGPHK